MNIDFKKAKLEEFLEHKTMYYEKIDLSIINNAWNILSQKIKLPYVIHIVGTNGKGSTGRFLSHYLQKTNYSVVHYSSPHIMKFNERIWINGEDVSDNVLEDAHNYLQNLYDLEILQRLSYFEYTTLLCFYLSNNADYLVLEAGLGGEFDATNVAPNNLSLITTIDVDHEKFLGTKISEIAGTKMRSVDKKMIIGYQIHDDVSKTAYDIQKYLKEEKKRKIEINILEDFDKYKLNDKFASYLKRNLHLVIACIEELGLDLNLEVFDDTPLFGRCQKVSSNITIDVGHNPLAASVLVKEFENQKVTLIYNSYEDKDYKKVLEILKPIINEIFILPIDDKRMVEKNNLLKIIKELNIIICDDLIFEKDKNYLAFGSFLVVEKFLSLIGFNEK